jgi:urease accessory protein
MSSESRAGWVSSLHADFRSARGRTVMRSRHQGALRCLASLYPEGDGVCHQVLVHPPGGLVGGDRLDVRVDVHDGAHALLTTPGASRFYRSLGAPAVQTLDASVRDGARLEWLPLENIAFDACLGENVARFHLAPGAELIAWDMLALGLPAAGRAISAGRYLQHMELPGSWLDRACIDAADAALLHGPGGLAGHAALGTLIFASGRELDAARCDTLLSVARRCAAAAAGVEAGVTRAQAGVLVMRALGPRIEPIGALLRAVWAEWRQVAWGLPACAPRVWST